MSLVPVLWPCELTNSERLSVGSKFHIKCSGNLEVQLGENLNLELPEGTPAYTIKLLKTITKTPKELDLLVTSYLPGEHQLKFIRITDGQSAVDSGELKWAVESVLAKDSQPFLPIGTGKLEFPMSLIVTAAIVLVVLGFCAALLLRNYKLKKQLQLELEEHSSSLEPKVQFEKSLRQLRRSMNWSDRLKSDEALDKINLLDLAMRVFLMRQFGVLTLSTSNRSLLKLVIDRADKKDHRSWKALLSELKRFKEENTKLDKESVLQLTELAQRLVDKL